MNKGPIVVDKALRPRIVVFSIFMPLPYQMCLVTEQLDVPTRLRQG